MQAKAWPKNTGNPAKDRQFFCSELAVATLQAAVAVVFGKAASAFKDCKPTVQDVFRCAEQYLSEAAFITAAKTKLHEIMADSV